MKNRKLAFTLAELLITLGIIGIAAAMTLPTLIQKINDKENIVKWKKMYSVLLNTHNAVKAEGINLCVKNYHNACTYGNTDNWDLNVGFYNPEYIRSFLSKLNVQKTCGSRVYKMVNYECQRGKDWSVWDGWSLYASLGGKQEYRDFQKTYGRGYPKSVKVASNGYGVGYGTNFVQSTLLLDGTVLYFLGEAPYILVDVNGFQNGPNILGKDLFGVVAYEHTLVPMGGEVVIKSGASPIIVGDIQGCSKDIGKPSGPNARGIAGSSCSQYYLTK